MSLIKSTALRRVAALGLVALLGFTTACNAKPGKEGGSDADQELYPITFSLDWVANTNHTGLFVAIENGYFKEAGLDVTVVSPAENSAMTLTASGEVDFAIDAQDTMAAALSLDEPLAVTAVAAILQHNTSGILSRKGEGLDRPAGLAGTRYATWNNPVELAMVEALVTADGGTFADVELIPNTVTDEAAALRAKQVDSLWIFYAWSGINAELSGVDTDFFYLKDLNPVFDYYTPVVIANNDFLAANPVESRAFLRALTRGYEYAIENPAEAAEILIKSDTTGALEGATELVMASQEWITDQYQADQTSWGLIDAARWDAFYAWLYEEGLIGNELPAGTGFTNDYLPN